MQDEMLGRRTYQVDPIGCEKLCIAHHVELDIPLRSIREIRSRLRQPEIPITAAIWTCQSRTIEPQRARAAIAARWVIKTFEGPIAPNGGITIPTGIQQIVCFREVVDVETLRCCRLAPRGSRT